MIFFTSHVKIDHTLGIKKRSYINKLNEHCSDCDKEVERIHKLLNSCMKKYSAHIIGLEKNQ